MPVTFPSLMDHVRKMQDEDFSPERMRDCAKMLRTWTGKGKQKALRYADMLDRLAGHDEWARQETRRQFTENRWTPDYDADQ